MIEAGDNLCVSGKFSVRISWIIWALVFHHLTRAIHTVDAFGEESSPDFSDMEFSNTALVAGTAPRPATKRQVTRGRHRGGRPKHSQRSTNDDISCCYNGGLCVFGSFCHCPTGFYGRFCEFSYRPCGPIPHGEWLNDECAMCHCNDGVFSCLAEVLGKCGGKPSLKNHLKIEFFENTKSKSSNEVDLVTESSASADNDIKPEALTKLMKVINQMNLEYNSCSNCILSYCLFFLVLSVVAENIF